MNYTLHQLQVFSKVVQTRSITRAAEELFMTQPAVSIQLKNFQEQFDIPLTELIGRQLYVTDFGKEIYQLAERIINEMYAINYKTASYKGLLSGRLSISTISTGKYVMPYFVSGFMREHSAIELTMDVTNKTQVFQGLLRSEFDFALSYVLPNEIEVESEIIMQNELRAVGPADGIKTTKPIKKEQFAAMPMIFREEGSGTRQMIENYFGTDIRLIKRKINLTSNEAVKQAVIAGLGYSILPTTGIRHELAAGEIRLLKVEGLPIKTQWRLIWLKNKQLSPVAEAFVKFLRSNKKQIVEKHFQLGKLT